MQGKAEPGMGLALLVDDALIVFREQRLAVVVGEVGDEAPEALLPALLVRSRRHGTGEGQIEVSLGHSCSRPT